MRGGGGGGFRGIGISRPPEFPPPKERSTRHSNRDGRALKKTWNWLMHLPATWSGGVGDADGSSLESGVSGTLELGISRPGICWWYVNSFKWIALYADSKFGLLWCVLPFHFHFLILYSFLLFYFFTKTQTQLIFGRSRIFWLAYYCYNNDVQKHLCHLKGHS